VPVLRAQQLSPEHTLVTLVTEVTDVFDALERWVEGEIVPHDHRKAMHVEQVFLAIQRSGKQRLNAMARNGTNMRSRCCMRPMRCRRRPCADRAFRLKQLAAEFRPRGSEADVDRVFEAGWRFIWRGLSPAKAGFTASVVRRCFR
jgi:hypothetical protein